MDMKDVTWASTETRFSGNLFSDERMRTIDDAPSGPGVAVAVNTFMSIKPTHFKHTLAFHHSHAAVFQDQTFRYFSDLSQNYKNKTQTVTLPGWLLLGLPLLPPGTHTCCEHRPQTEALEAVWGQLSSGQCVLRWMGVQRIHHGRLEGVNEEGHRENPLLHELLGVIRVMNAPQSRGCTALLLLPPTHTLRWNAHFNTHTDYFATWLNTVYFLICLILWCTCSVLLWCGVGGGVPLDSWVGQRRFRISVTVTFSRSLFYLLVFLRGDVLSVTFLSSGSWPKIWKKPFCWNWSQAHSWLFSVCAVVWIQILSCCDNTTCV